MSNRESDPDDLQPEDLERTKAETPAVLSADMSPREVDDLIKAYFEAHTFVQIQRPEVLARQGREALRAELDRVAGDTEKAEVLGREAEADGVSKDLHDLLEARLHTLAIQKDALRDALDLLDHDQLEIQRTAAAAAAEDDEAAAA